MAQFVGQLFFTQTIGVGVGWSETYYPDGEDYPTAITNIGNILTARLAMLPVAAKCVYARVSDTGVRGDSLLLPIAFPQAGGYTDALGYLEPLAVQCREEAGALYRATRWVRGVPLDCVTTAGLFIPTAGWTTAFTSWRDLVVATTWLRVRSKTDVARPIIYAHATAMTIVHFRPRKVGRPFGLLRGRQTIS